MEKASIEPPEEEEEERPVVNGNGEVITPGQSLYPSCDYQLSVIILYFFKKKWCVCTSSRLCVCTHTCVYALMSG